MEDEHRNVEYRKQKSFFELAEKKLYLLFLYRTFLIKGKKEFHFRKQ